MSNHKCLRCGHQWEGRIPRKPKQCPFCKSLYWNKPYSARTIKIAGRVRDQKGSCA